MLISGGKVLAIDKVFHDRTMSGDGQFIPLGVDTTNLLTKTEAENTYQPKGNYATKDWVNGSFLTKYEANQTFATIAGTYSKTESDTRFQEKGNYASATDVTELRDWVEHNYWTSAYINTNYATTAYVSATKEEVLGTIRAEIDPRLVAVENHTLNTDIHVSEEQKTLLTELAGLDFSKFISLTKLSDPNTAAVYGIRYDGTNYWFAEAEGGGGGGGYPIVPQAGISGQFDDIGQYHIGIANDELLWDSLNALKTASSTWDAKQNALTQEQLDAIDSITDTYEVTGDGTCIAVASDPSTKITTISYIGRQGNVELVQGEPAEPNPVLIYLVTQMVDL